MKLEVNKKYFCRNAPDVEYVKIDHIEHDIPDLYYHVYASIYYKDGSIRKLLSSYDLTEEYNNANHICEFIDPGFGKEMRCKHEGCKNTKDF